jgi:hypothetical protein
MIGGEVGVTLNLNNGPVADVNENATPTMATSTIGAYYFFFNRYTHTPSLRGYWQHAEELTFRRNSSLTGNHHNAEL